jgi:ferrous iron transport protein A
VSGPDGGSKAPITLNCAQRGDEVEVLELRGGWGIRQRLNQIGIHEGDVLLVKRSAMFGGPIVVEVHGTEMALGRGMARHLTVRRVN